MSSPRERPELRSIAVLSDLHLATGGHAPPDAVEPNEQFFHDQELASLLDHLISEGVEALLLLGDVFELPGGVARGRRRGHYHEVRVETLIERLDRISCAHPAVFDALRGFVAAGGRIQFVPGNHDHALHDGAVFDRLCWHLGTGSRPAGIEFHPWVIHVPGFMYAEHGHVHHVVNAFRHRERPVTASLREPGMVRLEDPLGATLCRAHLEPHDSPMRWMRAVAFVARSALAHIWSLRGDRSMRNTASPLDAVRAGTSFTWPRAIAAVTRIGLRRLDPRRPHYLQTAAERVHSILDAHGQATPIYVFGHSHRPEARQLPNGTCLLNAGSWITGSQTRSSSSHSLPYGYIWRDPVTGEARCDLRWWPTAGSE